MPISVGMIVGSLREGAYTRMLERAAMQLAPSSWKTSDIAIGDLPHYNQDLETDSPPPAWTTFRNAVGRTDGTLIITPEYNRGMPGALKNAFDVGSRPWGKSIWNGKPTAVVSLTPGALGGMSAHQQVRHTLSILNSPAMPGPEVYLHSAASLFDEAGNLKSAETSEILTKFLAAFEVWIGRFAAPK
jgi:chromate reductase, NAD(P)H dehydrogenase (quinone)